MFHYNHFETGSCKTLCQSAALTPLLIAIMSATTLTTSVPATAATPQSRSQTQDSSQIYKVHFNADKTNAVNSLNEMRLDWRMPSRTLSFDVPESHWIESAELMIAGTPDKKTGKHLPIFVKFNNAKVVPLNPHGLAFDARINLNARHLRRGRNQIRFYIPKPAGYACMAENHGSWDLNLKSSFLVVKARRKIRDYQVRDLKMILQHPDFAPKSVSLNTKGSNALQTQALLAQAVALRTPEIPEFRPANRKSDLTLITGTRSQLKGLVTDSEILSESGPRLYMHKGQSAQLVITGDTEEQVHAMIKAFGTFKLPDARRNRVGLSELTLQKSFIEEKTLLSNGQRLKELKAVSFADNWGPEARQLTFDVSDRLGSESLLTLPISRTEDIDASSAVTIRLNGTAISETRLASPLSTIKARFNHEQLRPYGNILTIEPNLSAIGDDPCGYQDKIPGLFVEEYAKLEVRHTVPTPITELSRFTASGAPFSLNGGKKTTVAFTSDTAHDVSASLKVMAHLARVSGTAWVETDYVNLSVPTQPQPAQNTLVIGPKTTAITPFLDGAPKSLAAALADRRSAQDRTANNARIDRFASANSIDVMRQYAQRHLKGLGDGSIKKGGLAGLYASKTQPGVLNGIISVAPGESFSNAANAVIDLGHWNALTGSVARWNRSEVLMVQIAKPVAGFDLPITKSRLPKTNFSIAAIGDKWEEIKGSTAIRTSSFAERMSTKFDTKFKGLKPFMPASKQTKRPVQPSGTLSVPKSVEVKAPVQKASPKIRRIHKSLVQSSEEKMDIKTAIRKATEIHKPYVRPKPRSLTDVKPVQTVRSAELKLPKIKTPDLRLDLKKNSITQSNGFKRSVQSYQKKLESAKSELGFGPQTPPMRFKFEAAMSKAIRSTSNKIPVKTKQTYHAWTQEITGKPGIMLILAFIASFILLGLASPISRLGRKQPY